MLSVQSVNLMRQPAFTQYHADRSEYVDFEEVGGKHSELKYSKEAFEDDKSKLEQNLEELNAIIENKKVPKPLRAVAKLFSIGIGAAVGFISMRFGTQGVVKIAKKGHAYAQKLVDKPFMKNISEKLTAAKESSLDMFANVSDKLKAKNWFAKPKAKLSEAFAKFKETKFVKKIIEFFNKIAESKPVKFITDEFAKLKNRAKAVTSEQVENGVVNLFSVSGGVTGAVTGLQEAVKEN